MGCCGSKDAEHMDHEEMEHEAIEEAVNKAIGACAPSTIGRIVRKIRPKGLLNDVWRVLVHNHTVMHALPKMGILQTERKVRPPAMSDITTTNSYLYENLAAPVKGLTYEQVLRGDPLSDEQTKLIEQAVRDLEAKGVMAIGGDMGSLYAYQGMIAKLTQTPVAMSALIQAPLLAAVYQPSEKILVLTTDSVHLTERKMQSMLLQCGVRQEGINRFVLQGAQSIEGFSTENISRGKAIDPELVCGSLIALVQEAKRKEPALKAVLIESEMFPMFSDAMRKVMKCGVFDTVTLLDFIHMSRTDNPRFGIEFGKNKLPPPRLGKSMIPGMGILRIDYTYPPALGDAAHTGSYHYCTWHEHVSGLTFEAAQKGDTLTPAQRTAMQKAIKDLEARPCLMGIAGDCGFLVNYQKDALAAAMKVPIFISAMLQAPILASLFDKDEIFLVLTANGPALEPAMPKILSSANVAEADHHRFHVRGCEDLPGFEAVALGKMVDVEKVQPHVVRLVREFRAKNESLRAVLLECTELPPYADAIREATGLMVLDAITIVDYFHSAVSQNPYYGIDWAKLAQMKEEE